MPDATAAPIPLFAGLDAGGSKTELLCLDGDGGRASYRGSGANVQHAGHEGAARVLASILQEALADRPGARLVSVCAGIAGAGRPADGHIIATLMRNLLGEQAPVHLHIVHDGEIALEAAFEGGSGILLITGTGSIAVAHTKHGDTLRTGGWGPLLGDEGSGYVLGLAGLKAVAAAIDGGPATSLRELLLDVHGIGDRDTLIHEVYRAGWKVQGMAPLVIRAAGEGDAAARRIIADQTDQLARQVRWLAEKASPMDKRIALMGGLTNEPPYREALTSALRSQLPDWSVEQPRHPPVEGALRIAQRLARNTSR